MNIGNTKVWLITDRHINHENIKKFCGRPDNYVKVMHDNWKLLVKPEDIVIDLGDVIFKNASELGEINNSLPGKKILVMGNHDRNNYSWYMRNGFDFVCDMFVWEPIVFSHHPLKNLPDGCVLNIHGHLHNSPYDNPHDPFRQKPWHQLIALELDGYLPIELDDFLRLHNRVI